MQKHHHGIWDASKTSSLREVLIEAHQRYTTVYKDAPLPVSMWQTANKHGEREEERKKSRAGHLCPAKGGARHTVRVCVYWMAAITDLDTGLEEKGDENRRVKYRGFEAVG